MRTDARVERRLGAITPNKQRYEAVRAADWLDAVRRQVCPFCGAGPFTVVASHVRTMHGITALELRDMLGVPRYQSICDPVFADNLRSVALQEDSVRRLTPLSRDAHARAGRTHAEKQRQAKAERNSTVLELAGARVLTIAQIATKVGISERTASQIVRDAVPNREPLRKAPAAVLAFNCANCGKPSSKKASQCTRTPASDLCCSRSCAASLWRAKERDASDAAGLPLSTRRAAAARRALKTATAPPTGAGGAVGSDHSAKPHTNKGDTQ